MNAAILIALGIALLVFIAARSRQKAGTSKDSDSTPALETWITGALENELAANVLGMRAATDAEKKPLARTLRGEPDVDVVSKIEDAVKSVDLEYLRYAHEDDAEVTLRVQYENGRSNLSKTRLSWLDLPPSVRRDFETKGTMRVFRPWSFPWART